MSSTVEIRTDRSKAIQDDTGSICDSTVEHSPSFDKDRFEGLVVISESTPYLPYFPPHVSCYISQSISPVETLAGKYDWRGAHDGMATLLKSRLLRFVERAMVLARRAVAWFSTRYSRKRFTLRQLVVPLSEGQEDDHIPCLVDKLIEMPCIRDALELDSIPAPSTLYKAFDRLSLSTISGTKLFARWTRIPFRGESIVRINTIRLDIRGIQAHSPSSGRFQKSKIGDPAQVETQDPEQTGTENHLRRRGS